MKEQIIQIPDTLKVKEIKDGKIILVEKEKKLTYKDIATKLFYNKHTYTINYNGTIQTLTPIYGKESTHSYATSYKQVEKFLAINMLMNVAKYLNGDWQPDWNDCNDSKYYIQISYNDKICIAFVATIKCGDIYFKSKELAEQAIEILGEETIKLALCTDY